VPKYRIVKARLLKVRVGDILYQLEGYIGDEKEKYKVISKTNLKTGKVEYIIRKESNKIGGVGGVKYG